MQNDIRQRFQAIRIQAVIKSYTVASQGFTVLNPEKQLSLRQAIKSKSNEATKGITVLTP